MSQADFEQGESAYSHYAGKLSESISEIRLCTSSQIAEERAKCNREARIFAQRAEEAVNQMTQAKDNMAPREKRNANQKVKQYRADLDEQKQTLEREMQRDERQELLSGGGSSTQKTHDDLTSARQRSQLIQAQKKVDKGSASLQRSTQQIMEAQQMGNEGLVAIQEQGEQIKRTRERAQDISVIAKAGGAILRRMKCRAVVHKFALVVVMVLLFAAIIALGVVLAKKK